MASLARVWSIRVISIVVIPLSGALPLTSANCFGIDKLPSEVRQALEGNGIALDPISIHWGRTRSSRLSLKELLAKIGSTDTAFFQPTNDVYRRQDGMVYFSCPSYWMNDTDSVERVGVQELAFDGRRLESGNGAQRTKGHSPGLMRSNVDSLVDWMKGYVIDAEYFVPAGFFHPKLGIEMKIPPQSMVLHLIDQGAEVTGVQHTTDADHELVRLELTSANRTKYKYWLSPKYHYAVERSEEYDSLGRLRLKVENGEFTRLSGTETWLPWESVVRYYSFITLADVVFDQPLFEDVYRVVEANKDTIPVSQFSLSYVEPGTYVTDGSLRDDGQLVTYRVPANVEDLDLVIAAALEGRDYQPPFRGRARYLIIVLSVSVVLLLGIFLWRWQRTGSRTGDRNTP